jgi:hypothetical protein
MPPACWGVIHSKALAHDEKRELKYASGVDGLDQEIAILRVKFRSLLLQDGQNIHLLNRTAETLAKLYSIKFSLSKNDTSKLKEAVTAALADFIIPGPDDSQFQPPAQLDIGPNIK